MFNSLFLKPIYNIVIFFLNIIPNHDIGIAIILTTILVKLILLPVNLSSQKSSYLMKEAQIEIEEINKKHKGDSKKIAEETMKLYKEKKINVFSSFFALLIQLPVFFALYYVFRDGIHFNKDLLYSYLSFPESVKNLAFGILDLTSKYWWLGLLTGITMYIYSKRQSDTFKSLKNTDNNKKEGFKEMFAKNMQLQMTYFLPVISGVSAAVLPAVIGIYWITNNILNIFQDIYIKRKLNIDNIIKK